MAVLMHTYSLPLSSLDYGTWGVLQVKIIATTHCKMGFLKQTIWQLLAAEVWRCGEIASRSGCAGEDHYCWLWL
jgi:hypothetical protein